MLLLLLLLVRNLKTQCFSDIAPAVIAFAEFFAMFLKPRLVIQFRGGHDASDIGESNGGTPRGIHEVR